MKNRLTLLALGTALMLSAPARAADIDWKRVDAVLGKTAAVSGEVHRYGLPRSDLHVTLDSVSIKPPSLLSWTPSSFNELRLPRSRLKSAFCFSLVGTETPLTT